MRRLLFRWKTWPWWAFAAIALISLVVAAGLFSTIQTRFANQRDLALAPPPRAIDLTIFRKNRDIHFGQEVHLTGQIDPFHRYAFGASDGQSVFVIGMTGTTDQPESAPRAGLLFDHETLDDIAAFTERSFLSHGRAGPRVRVGGVVVEAPHIAALLERQLADNGLRTGNDFVIVRPFLNGRIPPEVSLPQTSWLLPLVPLALAWVMIAQAHRSWSLTPVGMYAALKAQQHRRRAIRAAGIAPLPARSGTNSVAFLVRRRTRAIRVFFACLGYIVRKLHNRLAKWVDRQTHPPLDPADPFNRVKDSGETAGASAANLSSANGLWPLRRTG